MITSEAQHPARPVPESRCRTLTVPEIARALGISKALAYMEIAKGTFPLPVLRIGGRVVVSRAALDRYLDGESATGCEGSSR